MSLVSGYPSRLRLEKPLAFLEAYADDSSAQTGDRRLFLAGYLNSAQNWAMFNDAWDECLKTEPKINYLKMAEANGLRDQFDGWPEGERNQKLRRLSFIIAHFQPISFSFSISCNDFEIELGGLAPRGLNPHFISTFGVIAEIVHYLEINKVDTPVKFIFDAQHGVDVDLHLFFEWLTRNLSPSARRLISGTPRFEDDIDLAPLQAADMLAWHIRREHELNDCDQEIMSRLIGAAHLSSGLDVSQLRDWREEFSRLPMLDQMQKKTDWQRIRKGISQAKGTGYRFPYGSRWRNAKYMTRDWIFRSVWRISRYFGFSRR